MKQIEQFLTLYENNVSFRYCYIDLLLTEVFGFGAMYVNMGLGMLSEKVRLIFLSSLKAVTFTYWDYSLLLSY